MQVLQVTLADVNHDESGYILRSSVGKSSGKVFNTYHH